MPTSRRPPAAASDDAAATRAVSSVVRVSRLLERSCPEVNLAHFRILSAVALGEERASRLAARLAVGKPAVSAAVDALCHRGLLRRGDVERDQRAAALALTPEGHAVLSRAQREMATVLTELCSRTPDGAAVLICLGWLDSAVEEVLAQRMAVPAGAR